MIGIEIAAFIFALSYLGTVIHDRKQKRVEYVVHIQGQTEQAEHMDFAVSLFAGETEGVWKERLSKAFQFTEERRGFQGQRLIDLQKKHNEEIESQMKLKLAEKKEG